MDVLLYKNIVIYLLSLLLIVQLPTAVETTEKKNDEDDYDDLEVMDSYSSFRFHKRYTLCVPGSSSYENVCSVDLVSIEIEITDLSGSSSYENVDRIAWEFPPEIGLPGTFSYGNVSSVGLVPLDFKPPIFDVLGRSSYENVDRIAWDFLPKIRVPGTFSYENDEDDYDDLEVMDSYSSFRFHKRYTLCVPGSSSYGNVSSVGLVSLDFKPPIFGVLGRSSYENVNRIAWDFLPKTSLPGTFSYDSEISLTRKNITNLLPLELLHENVFGYGMADAGFTQFLLCTVCVDFTLFIAIICHGESGRIMRFMLACGVVTKGLLKVRNRCSSNGRRRFQSLLLRLHKETRINAKRNQNDSAEKHSIAATDVATTADAKRTLCKVCLDEEMCVMFLPCCHLATCESCADRLHCCVVCRSSIEGSFNVTMM